MDIWETKDNGVASHVLPRTKKLFFAFLRSKSLCCSVASQGRLHWRNESRMHHCDAKFEKNRKKVLNRTLKAKLESA